MAITATASDCITEAARLVLSNLGEPERLLAAHHPRKDGRCHGCGSALVAWPCVMVAIARRAQVLRTGGDNHEGTRRDKVPAAEPAGVAFWSARVRRDVPTPTERNPDVNPDRARELLTAELRELDDRAAFAAESVAESAPGAVADDDFALGTHPADTATDETIALESEGLARTVELQRRRVRDALDRLDAGTYGQCRVCGRAIDDERLEARPEVATCREHAEALPVGG